MKHTHSTHRFFRNTLFISYNYIRNLQASIYDFSGLWLSCLDPLIVLLQTFGKLFGFQIFLLWVYLMKVIPECHCILLNKNIFIWCTKSISLRYIIMLILWDQSFIFNVMMQLRMFIYNTLCNVILSYRSAIYK
jgi:hypothetical protein